MRSIGSHHQTLSGFARVPLSDTLVVPIRDRQIAFQHVEKLCKGVPMKWNTHTRHNRHLKNGKGVARVFSQCPPQQLHRPDIQRRAAGLVVLNNVVMNDFFKRCGEILHKQSFRERSWCSDVDTELVSCAASTPLVRWASTVICRMNRYRPLQGRLDRLDERVVDPRRGLAMWSSPSLPDAHTGCFPVAAP